MKKLTLVLVALLLALTCVFVACGKKNETPVDNKDSKPADDTTAPVENPTIEDMTLVAEQLKKDIAANYVDLYSKEVADAIATEKSDALAKIYVASSTKEAQKIADEFISFLKEQKTSYDVLKDLVAQFGDVALADEDLIKEAASYVTALNNAYAGSNEAKKAVLDAFKADKATKKAVTDAAARLQELVAIKEAADDEKAGVNKGVDTDTDTETIAELKKLFTGETYEFTMKSYDAYEAVVAAVEKAAENKGGTTGAIKADSKAYAEIFDLETLAEMKALLDAAIAAKPAMADLKAIIDAAEALKATAEDARYVETIVADKTDLAAKDDTHTIPVKDGDAIKYVTAKPADNADEENLKTYEIVIATTDKGENLELYKLSLLADIKAAEKLVTDLTKKYTGKELTNAGYVADGEADKAMKDIAKVRADYNASLAEAETRFTAYLGDAAKTTLVSAAPKKADTIGTFSGFETATKNYKTKLSDEINKVVGTFKTVNASGYKVATTGYINEGDYTLSGNKFYLINGSAAIHYTAWTYSYKFGDDTLITEGTPKTGELKVAVFDVLDQLAADAKAEKAEAALKWLVIFIGEGEYAEKYELKKDDGFSKDYVLYMTDRDVKEVATAKVAEINGADVNVAADAATEIKMLSSYTVAKAVVEAYQEIKAAQDAAKEDLKAAVLALREVGSANAIADARTLYNDIKDGSYVNKKLNGDAADAKKNGSYAIDSKDLDALDVVIVEATADDPAETAKLGAMLTAAEDAYDEAIKFVDVKAITDAAKALEDAKDEFADNEALVAAFAEYVKKAAEEVARCQAAYELTTTDTARIEDQAALDAAKAAQEKVNALSNLILDKAAFASINYNEVKDTYSVLQKTDDGDEIWALIKGYTTFKDTAYDKLDGATDELKDKKKAAYDLCEELAKIYANAAPDQAELKDAVKEAEKALAKAFTDFKRDFTVAKKVDASTFFGKLTTFATDYKADYLNLTVSYTYGDSTITLDLFTEAYRQKVLANAIAMIDSVKTAATSLAGKDVLGTDWTDLVTANVNATEIKIDAQTSIEEAEKFVDAYTLSDATYKLDTVLEFVNAERKENKKSAITLEALKAAIK